MMQLRRQLIHQTIQFRKVNYILECCDEKESDTDVVAVEMTLIQIKLASIIAPVKEEAVPWIQAERKKSVALVTNVRLTW